MEDCSAEQEAAILSGEIIVCRRKADQSQYRIASDDEAESRYAEETMNQNDPKAPDLFGIPEMGITVAKGCFIPPCPAPPAYMIDFDSLPETPPGSDAERVGQGLAPRSSGTATDAEPSPEASTAMETPAAVGDTASTPEASPE